MVLVFGVGMGGGMMMRGVLRRSCCIIWRGSMRRIRSRWRSRCWWCVFDGQAVPGAFAQYLPIRVKNNKPCPIYASRPLTSPTSISEITCIRPLRPPPRNVSGKAVPSLLARYLRLGVKTTHPYPISASRPPTSTKHIFQPTYIPPM